ncbi:MAG: hypothetical protein IPL59_08700 [Candidatus Competibacteraceae bacterium]|nr:hypothetical protein [Candidatus Competibacteraceae bacterium]
MPTKPIIRPAPTAHCPRSETGAADDAAAERPLLDCGERIGAPCQTDTVTQIPVDPTTYINGHVHSSAALIGMATGLAKGRRPPLHSEMDRADAD